jgi:hypothetical protein
MSLYSQSSLKYLPVLWIFGSRKCSSFVLPWRCLAYFQRDALWQKTQLVRSVGGDPAGSPLYNLLGTAISEARRITDECLDGFRQQPD